MIIFYWQVPESRSFLKSSSSIGRDCVLPLFHHVLMALLLGRAPLKSNRPRSISFASATRRRQHTFVFFFGALESFFWGYQRINNRVLMYPDVFYVSSLLPTVLLLQHACPFWQINSCKVKDFLQLDCSDLFWTCSWFILTADKLVVWCGQQVLGCICFSFIFVTIFIAFFLFLHVGHVPLMCSALFLIRFQFFRPKTAPKPWLAIALNGLQPPKG